MENTFHSKILEKYKNTLALRENLLKLMDQISDQGKVVKIHSYSPKKIYALNSPAAIKHVLVDHPERFSRVQNLEVPFLTEALGKGLLTSDGEDWKKLRRMQSRPFADAIIPSYSEPIKEEIEHILSSWRVWNSENTKLDFFPILVATTSAISTRILFGVQLPELLALKFANALIVGQDYVLTQLMMPIPLPQWAPIPIVKKYKETLETVDQVLHYVLGEYKKGNSKNVENDLFSILLPKNHNSDSSNDISSEIRDQIVTALVAAPENMATTLVWSLQHLSLNPFIHRQFLRDSTGDYRSRYLREMFRLYPGAPILTRRLLESDEIDGVIVPKNAYVVLSIYSMHRNKNFWSDPEIFNLSRPEYDQLSVENNRYYYIPFGAGPRKCIGDKLAELILTITLPTILTHRRFVIEEENMARPNPRINLRPEKGFWPSVYRT